MDMDCFWAFIYDTLIAIYCWEYEQLIVTLLKDSEGCSVILLAHKMVHECTVWQRN